MTSTAQEPAKTVRAAAKTRYVILTRKPSAAEGSHQPWAQAGEIAAKSADAAIRAHAAKDPTNGLELVAIPARSWQPRKITVETSTKVTLG